MIICPSFFTETLSFYSDVDFNALRCDYLTDGSLFCRIFTVNSHIKVTG